MNVVSADTSRFDRRYLLVALLPSAVFVVSALLIAIYARPFDVPPLRLALFDVDKVGAARVAVLAGFMLSFGAGVGSLIFFGYTLRVLARRDLIVPLILWIVLAASAWLIEAAAQGRSAHDYPGRSLACIAAAFDDPSSSAARRVEAERLGAPAAARQLAGVSVKFLAYGRSSDGRTCANPRFSRMEYLGRVQFGLVALSFAGLVVGAICCLAAKPAIDPNATIEARNAAQLTHWETQSGWLNTYLYLAAVLLGTALVFTNAFFRWPGYVLSDAAGYFDHVAALVAYYGVVFTVMLASFYIPLATIAAAKVKALKPAVEGSSKLPDAFKGPLQILKIVVGLLSTTLAGALPGLLEVVTR